MKNRKYCSLAAISMLMLLGSCRKTTDSTSTSTTTSTESTVVEKEGKPVKVSTLSGLDVLPRYLIADTQDYHKADRVKAELLTQSQAIFDAKIRQLEEEAPDVLTITGGFTHAGERLSHEYVASKLVELKEALKAKGKTLSIVGLPSLTDIDSRLGRRYSDDSVTPTDYGTTAADHASTVLDGVSGSEFMSIYNTALYSGDTLIQKYMDSDEFRLEKTADASYADGRYAYAVRVGGVDGTTEGVTFIAMSSVVVDDDSNSISNKREFPESELKWVRRMATEARKRDDAVIVVSDIPTMEHAESESEIDGLVVSSYKDVQEAFPYWGIHYVITGGISMDVAGYTTTRDKKLYEIQTGPLNVYPGLSRNLTIQPTSLKTDVTMEVSSLTNVPYTDLSLRSVTIDDLTAYSKEQVPDSSIADKAADDVYDAVSDVLKDTTLTDVLLDTICSLMKANGVSVDRASLTVSSLVKEYGPALVNLVNSQVSGQDGNFKVSYGDFRKEAGYPDELADEENTYKVEFKGALLSKDKKSCVLYFTSDTLSVLIESLLDQADRKLKDPTTYDKAAGLLKNDILDYPLYERNGETHTMLEFLTACYQIHAAGDEETSDIPSWVKFIKNDILNRGKDSVILYGDSTQEGFINHIIDTIPDVIDDVFGDITIPKEFYDGIYASDDTAAAWASIKPTLEKATQPMSNRGEFSGILVANLKAKVKTDKADPESTYYQKVATPIGKAVRAFLTDTNNGDATSDLTGRLSALL